MEVTALKSRPWKELTMSTTKPPCDVDDGSFDRSLLEHVRDGPARRYPSNLQDSRPPRR